MALQFGKKTKKVLSLKSVSWLYKAQHQTAAWDVQETNQALSLYHVSSCSVTGDERAYIHEKLLNHMFCF